MSFLTHNMAVILTALTASTMAWIYGGTRAAYLEPVIPWLFVLMIQALFFFPQRRSDESTADARERVWHALKHDRVFWMSLGLLLLLAVPFINVGLCPNCDAKIIAQGLPPEPKIPFFPFCVNVSHHLNVFLWFVVALPCLLVTRHALTDAGKRLVLEMLVWNGFALAILGFVQSACGAPGPLWWDLSRNGTQELTFFSTFGYPNMAGDYFTTLFGLALALWRWHYEDVRVNSPAQHANGKVDRKWRTAFRKQHYMIIPAAVFFFAALNTLSRAAIILVTATAAVYFFHTLFSLLVRLHRAQRVKRAVWSLLVLALIVFFASVFMPEDLQREVDSLSTDAVLTRVTGKGQYHNRVATQLWKEHWLFGCGGWGYKHLCIPKMTPEELKQIQHVGGINVHNDYLQFMAEHGLSGFLLMVLIVLGTLQPTLTVWARLMNEIRFTKPKDPIAKPQQIFVLPAPAFFVLTTAVATLIHCFGDCVMRTPAVICLFVISLAAAPGFLPPPPPATSEEIRRKQRKIIH